MFFLGGALKENNGNSGNKTGFTIILSLHVHEWLIYGFIKNTWETAPPKQELKHCQYLIPTYRRDLLYPIFLQPPKCVTNIYQLDKCLFSFIKVSFDEQRTSLILLKLNLPIFPLLLVLFMFQLTNTKGKKDILSIFPSFLHLIFKSFIHIG